MVRVIYFKEVKMFVKENFFYLTSSGGTRILKVMVGKWRPKENVGKAKIVRA